MAILTGEELRSIVRIIDTLTETGAGTVEFGPLAVYDDTGLILGQIKDDYGVYVFIPQEQPKAT